MESAIAGNVVLGLGLAALLLVLLDPGKPRVWLRVGEALVWFGVLILVVALLTHDFSLDYVVRTTSRATPWPYRISALWGGMEGSLLFYTALTLTWGVRGVKARGRVEGAVVALVAGGLLLLTLLGANPFQRLDVPAVDGAGLLAILQHPAMIYHPPILYAGLTMLVVPFALTVGRLMNHHSHSRTWLDPTRKWLTWSWTWLALGMAAGANWAYIELGWGGFWAWDPVENTALLPWLAATVFLHASVVFRRDGRLRRWTEAFAMIPFVLSVLGIYLTRSGATGSIHSFAEDPVIGRVLLSAALVVSVVLVVLVAKARPGERWIRLGSGRDTWLAASSGLVTVALVFILVGSAYPAFLQVFWDRDVSVGPRFFVTTVLPVAVVVAGTIGFALRTTWLVHGVTWSRLGWFFGVAALVAWAGWSLAIVVEPAGLLVLAVSAGGVILVIADLIRRLPLVPLVAHLGLLLVLVGAGASSLGDQFDGSMTVGDTVELGPHRFQLAQVNIGESGRFIFAEGVFRVDDKTLRPQIRAYEDQAVPISEPALSSSPMVDLVVAVTQLGEDGDSFDVRIYVRPMVWWVWLGSLVLFVAGLLASRDAVSAARRREARAERPEVGTTT